MARNPAEEDTEFQVNSYVSKPGKDFSNQRMIGMGVFQSLHSRKGVREDYEVFLIEPSMSFSAKRSARSSAE